MTYARVTLFIKCYLIPVKYITPEFDSAIRKIKGEGELVELSHMEEMSFMRGLHAEDTITL